MVDVKNETLMEKLKPGYTVVAVNGTAVTGQPYAQVMKTVRTNSLAVGECTDCVVAQIKSSMQGV